MNNKTSLKQKFFRSILGCALIAGLFSVSSAFAALPSFPTSGSCSMLITKPVPLGTTMPYTSTFNILAVLTFTSATAGTMDYYTTRVGYATGGLTMGAPVVGAAAPMVISPITSGNGPTGGVSITITLPGGAGTVAANAVAVNGGNTILVQGTNDAFSGVCQF